MSDHQQAPVAWMQEMPTKGDETRSVRLTTVEALAREEWPNPIPLYTTHSRREWVGLTLEEIFDCTAHITRIQKDDWVATDSDLAEFAHVIEAKLKEKNA